MSGFNRPSLAGPMLAGNGAFGTGDQTSSAGLLLSLEKMPPHEMTFLHQACGRENWVPRLPWLCIVATSKSNSALSSSCETDVYVVTSVLPQLALTSMDRHGSAGF